MRRIGELAGWTGVALLALVLACGSSSGGPADAGADPAQDVAGDDGAADPGPQGGEDAVADSSGTDVAELD